MRDTHVALLTVVQSAHRQGEQNASEILIHLARLDRTEKGALIHEEYMMLVVSFVRFLAIHGLSEQEYQKSNNVRSEHPKRPLGSGRCAAASKRGHHA